MTNGSREVARAALTVAMTANREEEAAAKQTLLQSEIRVAASDFGGDMLSSVLKIIERAVAIAKRESVIGEKFHEEGAIAGAARDAVGQISAKAMGLNIGGKIGIARSGEHVAVALFFTAGLTHLDEVCVGIGHRAV